MSTNKPEIKLDSGCAAVVSKSTSFGNTLNSVELKCEIGESLGTLQKSQRDISSVCANEVKARNTIYQQQKTQQRQKSQFRLQKQLEDEEKLLEEEKELQKQLYSGANVAHGWRRVITQQNQVIYIR
jgi:hypothetical protein